MKRAIVVLIIIAAIGAGAGAYYMRRNGADTQANSSPPARGGGRERPQGGGGFGGFGGPRLPMTVELAPVRRADMSEEITVVGNLIGAATIEAVPKISGRLESVSVRLGDRVSRGQALAKVEDQEILEQVKQAEASFDVSAATIRQREADLKFAETSLERTRNLFERELVPKQTLEDAEARSQAAMAQVDLARAQHAQAQARLGELKINLSSTVIESPVGGFVGKRALDPGAWVTPSSSFISVVDIGVVRLIANVVEKDLRRILVGLRGEIDVDAYPSEKFSGRVARISPVLDPATRTAQIEVEIENPQFRLKPGMYAKVHFTVDERPNTLVVPANALVDVRGSSGVFLPGEGDLAKFQPIKVGLMDQENVEVTSGLSEGDRVVTTGAAALREGDRILLPGPAPGGAAAERGGGGRGGPGPQRGSPGGPGGAPAGQGPQSTPGGREGANGNPPRGGSAGPQG